MNWRDEKDLLEAAQECLIVIALCVAIAVLSLVGLEVF